MKQKKVLFYGTNWCPDSKRCRAFLDKLECPYDFIDLDTDEKAAEKVKKINKGKQITPTIILPNGKILVEPSNLELQEEINNLKLLG